MRVVKTKKQLCLEWSGCGIALIGAYLLAHKTDYTGYGFIFYLLSNVLWMVYGIITRAWGMIVMQVGFTYTSLLGVYNWLWV
jgi:hypothetical protein